MSRTDHSFTVPVYILCSDFHKQKNTNTTFIQKRGHTLNPVCVCVSTRVSVVTGKTRGLGVNNV